MAQEAPGQTLDATALVHEAYVRLVDKETPACGITAATSLPQRLRPCAASSSTTPEVSEALSGAAAAGGVVLEANVAGQTPREDLLALDEAIAKFTVREPVKARLVQLPFCRTDTPRNGRSTVDFTRNGRALLGLCAAWSVRRA